MMNLVWVINPETKKEAALKISFENLTDAFDYKEELSKKYPELIFYNTSGIDVDSSEMKMLSEIL